ncbi:hypothetical protein BIV04_03205 [Frigoribacterium sp. MCBA15_019]|nr:hypothetical protein BIV04_03205 [Frigoribacterium sp. MCBA15_019]
MLALLGLGSAGWGLPVHADQRSAMRMASTVQSGLTSACFRAVAESAGSRETRMDRRRRESSPRQ